MHAVKPPVFTCAFLGRLNAEKDPLSLIGIAKSLKDKHNFMIRVAGDGPLRDDLLNIIRKEHLDNHFIIHGKVEDVPQLLAESHCLLITSRWEGMPLSLLEAAAAGIPVVSTPVGNIPSFINSTNGYLGSINELPSLIEKVMDNYGEALIRGRSLKQTVVERFDIPACYSRHTQLYVTCAGVRGARV